MSSREDNCKLTNTHSSTNLNKIIYEMHYLIQLIHLMHLTKPIVLMGFLIVWFRLTII